MDVREKLEVIAHLVDHITYKEDIGICYDSDLAKVIEDAYMELKNGVTVQEWVSVEEPPKERGIYQVFLWDKEMERSKVWYGWFTGYDWSVYDIYGDGMRCEVTHWMPLPQPPKGE